MRASNASASAAPLAGEGLEPAPDALAAFGARHAPAHQRMQVDGQQRGFVPQYSKKRFDFAAASASSAARS